MEDVDAGIEQTAPAWAVFGDLMSGLLGAFVLLLVGVLIVHLQLVTDLQDEVTKRQVEEQRRMALEKALVVPLSTGRITLTNGRIGISGRVLFAMNSDQLQPEGLQLLSSLVVPLKSYLTARDEWLMISGFTDNTSIRGGKSEFEDNWELSAQRALTVTRALIAEGMPSSMVFAAAFGAEQPIVSNADGKLRAQNRLVEMAPVPKAINTKVANP